MIPRPLRAGATKQNPRMQSVAGELGEEIKHAVENKHLNARALKAVARLSRMDADKRVAELAAFDLYRTYAEEAGLFGGGHVGDLVEQAEAGDTEAEALGDVVANNVRNIKRGIRQTRREGNDRPADTEAPATPAE
jgi:hypothetical protein